MLGKTLDAHANAVVPRRQMRSHDVYQERFFEEVGWHSLQGHLCAREIKAVRQALAQLIEGLRGREVRRATAEIQSGDGTSLKILLDTKPAVDFANDHWHNLL